jgi:hypothetical protein
MTSMLPRRALSIATCGKRFIAVDVPERAAAE